MGIVPIRKIVPIKTIAITNIMEIIHIIHGNSYWNVSHNIIGTIFIL